MESKTLANIGNKSIDSDPLDLDFTYHNFIKYLDRAYQKKIYKYVEIKDTINKDFMVLGLSPEVRDINTVRKAYRKLALIYHPDKTKSDPVSNKIFSEINESYEKILVYLNN